MMPLRILYVRISFLLLLFIPGLFMMSGFLHSPDQVWHGFTLLLAGAVWWILTKPKVDVHA
jgi:hypothetical protein